MEPERALFLVSPNSVALPLLDRGRLARSATREAVDEQWPEIVHLVESGRVAEGIAAMEWLAREMRDRTARDPEDWRETLVLARRILYDDLLHAAWWGGDPRLAEEAFVRCRVWDEELREHLARPGAGLVADPPDM